MQKIFFQSSLPRAGSTLLQNIIGQNPNFYVTPTSGVLELGYAVRGNFTTSPEFKAQDSELMEKGYKAYLSAGFNAFYNAITDKPFVLDKSRGWIHYAPFLWKFVPDAKIIVCVRDLRSIVASLEKKWRENPEIIDNRDQPQNQAFITIDQRANQFLNDAPLGIALKRLHNAITTKTLEKMHIVKAEDFTLHPEKIMRGVYDFIGEDYHEMDYTKVKQVTIENDRINDFGIYGDHKIRESITPLPKDSNEILGTQNCQQIKAGFTWFYETFKYY